MGKHKNTYIYIYSGSGEHRVRHADIVGAGDKGPKEPMKAHEKVKNERVSRLSTDLYTSLTFLLEGEAETMLCNAHIDNGLEVWHKMQHTFVSSSAGRKMVTWNRYSGRPR